MVDWDRSIEQLLQKYCDEAKTRECLHRKAYYRFKKTNTIFQLPIIVLSAIAGSATFLSKGYESIEDYITNITGGISIFVSIISAVASYLKLGETKSKHEIAEISWQNFYNGLKHTLNLRRELRPEPSEYLQEVKTSYDRLFEISPICTHSLIAKVKKKLSKNATPEFQIPNYMNGWDHTTVYESDDEYQDNSV
tara:strand:+ start:126 stop:707 length:582 start_codon:yes stop_codon:yes gene_type:complete